MMNRVESSLKSVSPIENCATPNTASQRSERNNNGSSTTSVSSVSGASEQQLQSQLNRSGPASLIQSAETAEAGPAERLAQHLR